MKSLVILGPAHPYRGGIASFNERLAEEFQRHEWKVTLITFTLQYPSFLFPGKDQLHQGDAPKSLNIVRKINSINPLSWFRTAAYIRNLNPNLLITHFWHPYLGPALGNIIRYSKTKNISIVHNLFPHERKIGDNLLIKYYLSNTDKYLALSKKVKNDLLSLVDSKNVSLSAHPVYDNYGEPIDKNEAIKKLNLNPDFKYILFFGLIRKYKGLDLLLDAFAKSVQKNKNIKLIIAGEFYDQQNKYLEQIQNLQLEEQVIIHDHFIPNDEVKNYFSACELVAQTYHRATQSGIMQIAIQFQKPMLVTNVGGLSEMIQDNIHGYICEPKDTDIAKSINDYFNDSSKSKRFENNLLELKSKYSWKSFYDKLYAIHS